MPIQTDLSVSPYFDDYNTNKDYYKVLFRPGVAVQARELNQLQTILQKQIERFGDNIFKRGTIIDGCAITLDNNLQYVKIKDNQNDGAPVNVRQFIGYYVKDTSDINPLVASIQTVIDGFETTNDPKTLYVNYTNSGRDSIDGERQTFSADDNLIVYRPDFPIESITIANSSAGFSNSDSVVILPAIAIQNSTGGKTFTNNFYVEDGLTDGTANVEIVEVNTTANSTAVILRIKPIDTQLAVANDASWTLTVGSNVNSTNATVSDTATIVGIVGTGAAARLRTGTVNKEITSVTVTNKGSGYYVNPYVTVQSSTATSGQIGEANLVPQTELTIVTVGNTDISPIGSGYSVVVGDGVVYQKGYFSRVNQHRVIVNKYSNTGFDKVVGFDTTESIVDSNIDTSLLDNASGQPNATAPGANRLKLAPVLVVKTKAEADANAEFLSVVEFSEGNPYKQTARTVYNKIGDELARRTSDESGNYVIDPFILNTKHADTLAAEATSFKIIVDPGVAYINGRRVETVQNFTQTVDKGTDTVVANNATISLEYGSYIRVNELGGVFNFKTGDVVNLYNTAANFISGGLAGTTPSSGSLGTLLGTARIRSLVVESGTPGTSECVYRLYLFDIHMGIARNFKLIRSIFYNGADYKGVCDPVVEGGEAVLKNNNLSSLVFGAGKRAVKQGSGYSYTYRTINTSNTYQIAADGTITIDISASGDTFPYTGGTTLSPAQEQDIVVLPTANVQLAANAAGSVQTWAANNRANGTSTSFTTAFQAGDYIKLSSGEVRQINAIANDTLMFLSTNGVDNSGNVVTYFPQFVPIPLRADRSANVNSQADAMVIDLQAAVNTATNIAVAYNARVNDITAVSKTPRRDRYVRLNLSTHAESNTGPWCIGVPDVFHLKGVFLYSNGTFAEDGSGVLNVTNEYYVDTNQNEDYYGLSYLYRKTNANSAITTSDYLLLKFDFLEHAGEGLKAIGSYPINDTAILSASAESMNTLEIPEFYGAKGDYYDLRDNFDFRPRAVANATPVEAASVASAPVNPLEKTDATRFSSDDKKFPAPNGALTANVEFYQGRIDRVVMGADGSFNVLRGDPDSSEAPLEPKNAITINLLNVPPYPSQPYELSANTIAFVDRKTASERFTTARFNTYRVTTPVSAAQRSLLQPRGYTMVDIGSLERRIEALEYYTRITLTEALTQSRVIPSSSNNAIDRFKFGFFVDGFNDFGLAETNHPQYNASVVDGFLSPKVDQINLPVEAVTSTVSLPFEEVSFIRQPDATAGPVIAPTPPAPTPEVVVPVANTGAIDTDTGTIVIIPEPEPVVVVTEPSSNTTSTVADPAPDPTIVVTIVEPEQPSQPIEQRVQQTIFALGRERNTNRKDSGIFFDDYYYTFSSLSGVARFFINSRDNNIGVIVWQSTTENGPWTNIIRDSGRNNGADSSAITSTDITTYQLSSLNDGRRIESSSPIKSYYFTGTSKWREDQLKMDWTHNPDNGIYYKVRVYKGENHGGQGKGGTYGFKLFYPSDVVVSTAVPVNGFANTVQTNVSNYLGTIAFYSAAAGSGDYYIQAAGEGNFYAEAQTAELDFYNTSPAIPNVGPETSAVNLEQAFAITCTGLRPSTTHTFFFDGEDRNSRCRQEGGTLGSGLQTDDNGEIRFVFYYQATVETVNTTTQGAAANEMRASTKTINIRDTVGTSSVSSVITVTNYIRNIIQQPVAPPAQNIALNPAATENVAGGGTNNISLGGGRADIVGGGGGMINRNLKLV